MSESRRVAITGGNGVVGSALSSSYLKNEYDVVALDDPDIDILAEPEKFRRALKGVDTVIHLARSTGEGDHREMWRTPHRNPVNAELFHAALQGLNMRVLRNSSMRAVFMSKIRWNFQLSVLICSHQSQGFL